MEKEKLECSIKLNDFDLDMTIPEFAKTLRDFADVLEHAKDSEEIKDECSIFTKGHCGLRMNREVSLLNSRMDLKYSKGKDTQIHLETELVPALRHIEHAYTKDGCISWIQTEARMCEILKKPGILIGEALKEYAQISYKEMKQYLEG